MTRTRRAVLILGLALAVAAAACSSDNTASTTTTTTTKASSSSSSSSTTTTTTTTKATTTTATTKNAAALKSSDPGAVALDKTIVAAADLAAAPPPGVKTAVPIEAALTDSAPATGPLSFDGVVSIFPAAAASLYSDSLKKGEAHFGANEGAVTILDNGSAGPVVDILAIKFTSATTAGNYIKDATNVAVQLGGAKQTDHPEFKPADNVLPGSVLRVPPSPQDPNKLETVVSGLLYPNGVYYLVSILAPEGAVGDDAILALTQGQSDKYHASGDLISTVESGGGGSSSSGAGGSTTSTT